MGVERREVTVRLVASAAAVRPGEPLPLRIAVRNDTAGDLRAATAEVTAEVERGVLITWQVALRPVPASAECRDAHLDSSPRWWLPLNVPAGPGRWRVRLHASSGELLAEDEQELLVGSDRGPTQ